LFHNPQGKVYAITGKEYKEILKTKDKTTEYRFYDKRPLITENINRNQPLIDIKKSNSISLINNTLSTQSVTPTQPSVSSNAPQPVTNNILSTQPVTPTQPTVTSNTPQPVTNNIFSTRPVTNNTLSTQPVTPTQPTATSLQVDSHQHSSNILQDTSDSTQINHNLSFNQSDTPGHLKGDFPVNTNSISNDPAIMNNYYNCLSMFNPMVNPMMNIIMSQMLNSMVTGQFNNPWFPVNSFNSPFPTPPTSNNSIPTTPQVNPNSPINSPSTSFNPLANPFNLASMNPLMMSSLFPPFQNLTENTTNDLSLTIPPIPTENLSQANLIQSINPPSVSTKRAGPVRTGAFFFVV